MVQKLARVTKKDIFEGYEMFRAFDHATLILAEPLRTLGESPDTHTPITVKTGRFGPYVTDGTTLASVPKKSSVEAITLEEATDLLAKKRARGPSKFRGRKTTKDARPE